MGRRVSYRTAAVPVVIGIALAVITAREALAQLPPHRPGTLCVTQYFWCQANPPGPPGSRCLCPSNYGWVPGQRQ